MSSKFDYQGTHEVINKIAYPSPSSDQPVIRFDLLKPEHLSPLYKIPFLTILELLFIFAKKNELIDLIQGGIKQRQGYSRDKLIQIANDTIQKLKLLTLYGPAFVVRQSMELFLLMMNHQILTHYLLSHLVFGNKGPVTISRPREIESSNPMPVLYILQNIFVNYGADTINTYLDRMTDLFDNDLKAFIEIHEREIPVAFQEDMDPAFFIMSAGIHLPDQDDYQLWVANKNDPIEFTFIPLWTDDYTSNYRKMLLKNLYIIENDVEHKIKNIRQSWYDFNKEPRDLILENEEMFINWLDMILISSDLREAAYNFNQLASTISALDAPIQTTDFEERAKSFKDGWINYIPPQAISIAFQIKSEVDILFQRARRKRNKKQFIIDNYAHIKQNSSIRYITLDNIKGTICSFEGKDGKRDVKLSLLNEIILRETGKYIKKDTIDKILKR